MLTYSKIFNTDIPAEPLTDNWLIEDRIFWAREDANDPKWGRRLRTRFATRQKL